MKDFENLSGENLKIVLKAAVMELTEEEQAQLLAWMKETFYDKERRPA